ncbi:hypothetical protein GN956_G3429 [Arapaima gigas]
MWTILGPRETISVCRRSLGLLQACCHATGSCDETGGIDECEEQTDIQESGRSAAEVREQALGVISRPPVMAALSSPVSDILSPGLRQLRTQYQFSVIYYLPCLRQEKRGTRGRFEEHPSSRLLVFPDYT